MIEIGVETVSVGQSSLTLSCVVRNKDSKEELIRVEKLVFVSVNRQGRPTPHALADKTNNTQVDNLKTEPVS